MIIAKNQKFIFLADYDLWSHVTSQTMIIAFDNWSNFLTCKSDG
jgi:hypothetical protein